MAVFILEPLNLIFNRGTIPGPNTFNNPCVHRGAIQVCSDDVMHLLIGMRNPTRKLLGMLNIGLHHRKTRDGIQIPGLFSALRKVDGASVNACRCSRLQSTLREPQIYQSLSQTHGSRITHPSSRIVLQPHMHQAI